MRVFAGALAFVAVLALVHGCDDSGSGASPRISADVWAWGHGQAGQLGDGTTRYEASPVQVVGLVGFLTDVQAVAGGCEHTVALKTDGTVWAWGRNTSGQLGDGTLTDRMTPVQVVGPGGVGFLTDIQAISTRSQHTVALKTDGTVWTWGGNLHGELGDGTTTRSPTPVQVVGLTGVLSIAAANHHTLAVKTGGTVWAWGFNPFGQLGDGTTTSSPTPVQVVGPGGAGFLTDVQVVSAGEYHVVARKADGTVWTWGNNYNGQLGDGTDTKSPTPIQVLGPGGTGFLTGIQTVGAGPRHSLAVKADGTAWAWGNNGAAQLGDGTATDRWTPVEVVGLTGAQSLDAGFSHTIALKTGGTVWAWGFNINGTLGDGTVSDRPTPVQVVGPGGTGFLTDVQAIAAGFDYTIALKTDGTVWTWGHNEYGQIGNGEWAGSLAPVHVLGPAGVGFLTNVQAVSAALYHTVALKTDGTAWAWGNNGAGQLGDGTTMTVRLTPVQILGLGGAGFLSDVRAVSAGGFHTVAVKTDGTVWAWGDNSEGQLGDGTTTDSPTPVQVVGLGGSGFPKDIRSVSASRDNTVVVKTDGTVWAWGRNSSGQLGDGTETNSPTPVQVVGPGGSGILTNVKAVSAGDYNTVVVKTDGTVWAWGANFSGALGDGTTTDSSTPVQVVGPGGLGFLTGVGSVSLGEFHTVVVKTDGTVWAWGGNFLGEFGDGTQTDSLTPVQVVGPGGSGFLTDVISLSTVESHTVALKADGTVWAWGRNPYGQLGDGTKVDSATPVQVLGPGGIGFLAGVAAIAAGGEHTVALVP